MKIWSKSLWAVAASFSISFAHAEITISISGGTIIDGTGAGPKSGQTIVVVGDRISEIGTRVTVPDGAVHLDATGKTILPGFIEAHAHLMYPPSAAPQTESLATLRAHYFMQRLLYAGVTAARDTGGTVESMQALVNGQALGYIDSIRLFPVGQLITTTGGHGPEFSHFASGPDGFREAVRKMYAAGFRHIKLAPTYTQEEVNAAVDEAKMHGMQVTSHGGGLSDTVPESMTRRAVLAGVESIEHVNKMPLADLDLIAERGVHLVPTLEVYRLGYSLPQPPASLQQLIDKRNWSMAMHENLFKEAMNRGILMGIGTDATAANLDKYYPQIYFDEMEYFVRLGMSRLDVITAATRNGAIIIAREQDLGTLEPGKFADLQVIDGDPLASFDVLGNPELVMVGGRVMWRKPEQ